MYCFATWNHTFWCAKSRKANMVQTNMVDSKHENKRYRYIWFVLLIGVRGPAFVLLHPMVAYICRVVVCVPKGLALIDTSLIYLYFWCRHVFIYLFGGWGSRICFSKLLRDASNFSNHRLRPLHCIFVVCACLMKMIEWYPACFFLYLLYAARPDDTSIC